MKNNAKNLVKRNEVNAEIKNVKGTPCQVIKGLYSYKGEETKKLNKILPNNPKDLCAISARICSELHVGEVMKDKEGNVKLTAKGEERVYKFTQAALISWLLKNQKELKAILKEESEKRTEKAEKAGKKSADAKIA